MKNQSLTDKSLRSVDESREKKLFLWQMIVIITVFITYLLHYFCKTHLYVILNDFQEYMDPNPTKSKQYIGIMLSLGYVGYASGKIILALLPYSTFKSPLNLILITIVFAPIFSFLFAILDITNSTLRVSVSFVLWFSIRFAISAAWMGLVQLVSNWVPPTHHGRVMAFCNLSWLFGDGIARSVLGWTYHLFNDSWRSVFSVAATMTSISIIATLLFIRDTPISRGLPAIHDNADNVYAKKQRVKSISYSVSISMIISSKSNTKCNYWNVNDKPSTWKLLKPLLFEPLFYAVLILNFLYLFIRELYNMFFIVYLEDKLYIDKGIASTISAVVPFVGSISVIFCGWFLDKIKAKHWRLSVIPIFSVVTIFCLGCFAFLDLSLNFIIFLVILFGLSLYGPYSLMAGVLAVDIGGQRSAAMVSAFISAAGFSSGIIGSSLSAFLTYREMWFSTTCAATAILIVGILLFIYNYKQHKKQRERILV